MTLDALQDGGSPLLKYIGRNRRVKQVNNKNNNGTNPNNNNENKGKTANSPAYLSNGYPTLEKDRTREKDNIERGVDIMKPIFGARSYLDDEYTAEGVFCRIEE